MLHHYTMLSRLPACSGVLPGTSFTYRFKAEPAGTHSWHAHHGIERPEGLFGALIVHPRQPRQVALCTQHVTLA